MPEYADLLNKRDSPDNNNDNNNLLNKLLNKQLVIKSFSVRREDFPILAEFIKKAERENWDFSFAVMQAIREYVERHCIPNPQATLDRVLDTGLPVKPHDACCVPNCNHKAVYQLVLQDYEGKREIFRVCQLHKEWRHNRFKFIVGFKEL